MLIHENMVRGRSKTGWLDSFHTFSFGGFLDPMRMGFARLRVLNEDYIIPGAGFARHDHADMDILTLVLSGRIRHEDSLGNVSEIAPGEVQLMRAGSGIAHSEVNPSEAQTAHVLQIWLIPDRRGGAPDYGRLALPEIGRAPVLLASGDGASGDGAAVLRLGSDTRVWMAAPRDGDVSRIEVAAGRRVFVQLLDGLAVSDGERLVAGDGIQLAERPPDLEWNSDGRYLLFDMPAR